MDWFESAKELLAKWKVQQAGGWRIFTPRAQQVLARARKEAELLNNNFVGTEHILLGLTRLEEGVAVNILHKMGLDLETAKKEAKLLNHTYVGTEHLLLGLLHESEGVAAHVFKNLNVNAEQTRKEILSELDPRFVSGDDAQEKHG